MNISEKMIYVVDDESNIRELVKSYLENEGYQVRAFASAEEVLSVVDDKMCDMFVIDIMMPGMDGFTLCKELRKKTSVPVIMVSAKDDEIDKVIGLELGGDDYISKPFSPRELLARVRAVFRRSSGSVGEKEDKKTAANIIEVADVCIYPDERKVSKGNIDVELTSKEFALFVYLAENKNMVFNREQIISNVWGYDFFGDTRAVDDLIKRLRKKFAEVESSVEIKTVWGYGYKLSE